MAETKVDIILHYVNSCIFPNAPHKRFAGYSKQTSSTTNIEYFVSLFVLQMKEH